MPVNKLNWKIGGEAGYGIASAGAMFSRAMLRAGLYVFDYGEYPSLIRGGHNTFEVSVSGQPIYSPGRPINMLIALDQTTINIHRSELTVDAAIIYNTQNTTLDEATFPDSTIVFGMALEEMGEQAGAGRVARNVVALGASYAFLGLPFESLQQIIELNFTLKHKDKQVVYSNVAAARAGYDYVKRNSKQPYHYQLRPVAAQNRIILTGNDAISWGAIQAGCKFFAGYPMTPATSILHLLAGQAHNYNLVVKQTEDEISAINAAIGASYAGVRAMSATSGGGFDLMTEAWGMAAMVEVPLVVVEAMRPGPSTSMPTWGDQGDLKFLLNASHGEFPRFVLAPGDVEQCFTITQEAFNLAEQYQTPVMVITDKFLGESHKWTEVPLLTVLRHQRGQILTEQDFAKQKEYLRYRYTDSGVSPRVLPGTPGGEHIANSDEHNEAGFSEEGAEERTKMVDKRFRKYDEAKKHIPLPVVEGDQHADLTLISWGSTRGPILDALTELRQQHHKVNYVQIVYLSPFPAESIKAVFKKAKKVAIVENNKTGQLASLIREQTGLSPDYKILKYDGRPFFAHELVESLRELL